MPCNLGAAAALAGAQCAGGGARGRRGSAPVRLALRRLHVFVVAGEPSGDALGAAVMASLRARVRHAHERGAPCGAGRGGVLPPGAFPPGACGGSVRFSGVGGPLMRRAGLEVLFDMSDLAVMGLWELLPHIPRLLVRLRQARRAILDAQPDIVLTIDSKGFNFRLLRSISRNARAPWTTVHYVAPSVWAYKGDHTKTLQFLRSRLDLLLVLFPFESNHFREHVPTVCTGHPIFQLASVRAADDQRPPRRGGGSDSSSDSMSSTGATKVLLLPGAPLYARQQHAQDGYMHVYICSHAHTRTHTHRHTHAHTCARARTHTQDGYRHECLCQTNVDASSRAFILCACIHAYMCKCPGIRRQLCAKP